MLPARWRETLDVLAGCGLRGEDLERVVARGGLVDVLALVPEKAARVIAVLREDVRLEGPKLWRFVAQRPALLSDPERVKRGIMLLKHIHLDERDIGRVASKWPGLLSLDADRASAVVEYLCRPEIGFTRRSLRSLIRRAPWILVYDVETDIAPAVSWLSRSFIVASPTVSLEAIIRASPHVLGMSPDGMSEVVSFLGACLIFDLDHITSIVRQYPPVLTSSVDRVLHPAVSFLTTDLALSAADLARIVRAFPAILTLDVESEMRPNVEFFRAHGISNVGRIVSRLPPVLSYDIETNLAPKMHYLTHGLGLSAYDMLRFPGYFSYSLTKTIEPRTRFLQKLGVPVTQSGLNMALAPTDDVFCDRVAVAPVEHYHAFRRNLDRKRAEMAGGPPTTQERVASAIATAIEPGVNFLTADTPIASGSSAAAAAAALVEPFTAARYAAAAAAAIRKRTAASATAATAGDDSIVIEDDALSTDPEPEGDEYETVFTFGSLSTPMSNLFREGSIDDTIRSKSTRSSSPFGSSSESPASSYLSSSFSSRATRASLQASSPFKSSISSIPASEALSETSDGNDFEKDGPLVTLEPLDPEAARLAEAVSTAQAEAYFVAGASLPKTLRPLTPPRPRRRKRRLRATDARVPWCNTDLSVAANPKVSAFGAGGASVSHGDGNGGH
jgi:mTERF